MKKTIKIVILIAVLSLFAYFGYNIITKVQYKNQVAQNIKKIPNFEFQNIKGGVYTNANLKANTPKLFVYFNSECDYCNEEAQMIKEKINDFSSCQIIFISTEKKTKIRDFANQHQLLNYDNITFLSDSNNSFATIFDVKSMPCLVLYDAQNKLIEKIRGQTKAETLIAKLEKRD